MPAGLAFFDMDGTLVDGDCGVLFVRHCLARRLLPARELLGWGRWLLAVARRGLHEPEVAMAKSMLLRTRVRLGEAASDALYDGFFTARIRQRLRRDCRQELEQARREGPVFIVTANLRAMAIRLGAELGLGPEQCLGAEPVLDASGRPTEEVRRPIPMGEERARLIRELAARAQVPLAQVRAFGDSLHDVPMLRAVGQPCAVHPSRSLRRIAERDGWRLLGAGPPLR
jgi:HAD superfamily phosphoserine phosphatase-like hydrolase